MATESKSQFAYNSPPEFSVTKMLNPITPPSEVYAPEWWRLLIAGRSKGPDDPNNPAIEAKQAWASKSFQALVYAGLLGSLGYGSRKLLRGTSPEVQDALSAIDKYVPKGENPAAVDTSRLVDKDKYVPMKEKIRRSLKRVFALKDGTDDFNSLSYALPPAAAFMAWLVGQKLAEKEIENTDLSDSRARLAKARDDYNRTLASKLNPKARMKEKVIQDRLQNPLDYAIDQGIALKDKAVQGLKDSLLVKDAAEPASKTAATGSPNGWINVRKPDAVLREEIIKQYGRNDDVMDFLRVVTNWEKLTPLLVGTGVATFLGAGLYGFNNQRAKDKNLQKALDKEAAIKRRAMEVNDQNLDMSGILPGYKKPEL